MGQKVNPILFRSYFSGVHSSVWCAKGGAYADYLHSDIAIRKYVASKLSNASISKVVIDRKPGNIVVTLHSAKVGMLIGKKGADLSVIKSDIERVVVRSCAGAWDVEVNVSDVKCADLDPVLLAKSIAYQISKRSAYKRVMKRAMASCMRSGAKGVRISCSGRLSGAEIARTEWYQEGSIPLHTIRANVGYHCVGANTSYGVIGVKVWIYVVA